MIEIGINSEILAQILDGRKTVEGRLAKGKFLEIAPGDIISVREDIYKEDAIIGIRESAAKLQVLTVERFNTFEDMLSAKGFNKVIPNAKNLHEARDEYARYYSREHEKEYGVLAILFHVLSR